MQQREGSIEITALAHSVSLRTHDLSGQIVTNCEHASFILTKTLDSSSPYIIHSDSCKGRSAVWDNNIWHGCTGELWHIGMLIGKGYSGRLTKKNNPDRQHVKGMGPIPRGTWHIGRHTLDAFCTKELTTALSMPLIKVRNPAK